MSTVIKIASRYNTNIRADGAIRKDQPCFATILQQMCVIIEEKEFPAGRGRVRQQQKSSSYIKKEMKTTIMHLN
jgi:hypothetical protein